MTDIRDIEGVGEAYAAKLAAQGVKTVEALLDKGGTATGRKALAESCDISDKLILRWVNHADLFRLSGVKSQFAELLEAAGVDSVPELAQRKAANLQEKMAAVNAEKKLAGRAPTLAEVETWITQAKTLPRAVHH